MKSLEVKKCQEKCDSNEKVKLVKNCCGNLMTREEFVENVRCGGFIDYDGYGEYSDGVKIFDIKVYPSDIRENGFDSDFTHVVWYNK